MVDLAAQANTNHYSIPDELPTDAFRTYDIRGEAGEMGLTPNVAYAIGLAIGSEAIDRGEKTVIIGRDGRLTGPALKQALCSGLLATGCDVIDIGMVPTPLVYFATNRLPANSGVMVTASHNPAHHNGFKIVLAGKTLSTDGIQALLQRILQRQFHQGQGQLTQQTVTQDYIDYVCAQIHLSRPLKIVIDCGNGVAGCIAPQLYRALGCEVVELFCDVDGHFPNHHPDPTIPENLTALINRVKQQHADIGLAFDGDADRLGVVTDQGEIIWPDRQMMLFSKDLLSRQKGAKIVFDVKCSSHLSAIIAQNGGEPIMYRTGHSILKNKMFEVNAPLAGEMSGHIFFREDWFGFDDGLYVGARLLRILANTKGSVSALFQSLPNSINTPELKLPMAEEKKAAFMQRLLTEADFGNAKKITIDGLRLDFGYGWGLIRPSNTSPYLILRFEADDEQELEKIKDVFRQQLLKLDSKLELPY